MTILFLWIFRLKVILFYNVLYFSEVQNFQFNFKEKRTEETNPERVAASRSLPKHDQPSSFTLEIEIL